MKFLMSLIHTLVLAGLSIAVGLSLYSRFGGNLAERSIEQDFGPFSFFLTHLLGQLILYIILLLFVFYIILRSLLAKNDFPALNYQEVIRRTKALEKRQEAAFQHINQLEASWETLASNATMQDPQPIWRTVEFNKRFLQIKQELNDILNKIHQQKDGPTSRLLDSIQEQLEHLETQILNWVVQTSVTQIPIGEPLPFFDDKKDVQLITEETGPLPSRRERHKSFLKKLFNPSARSQAMSPSNDKIELDNPVTELPSRKETHSPWWRKRRASQSKSNVEK